MIKAALIGSGIGYTKSPEVHAAIAKAVGEELAFDVVDVDAGAFGVAAEKLLRECDGFFVTKPYKTDIKRHLDRVNTACGVNFVKCRERAGFNTDGAGFMRALGRAFGDTKGIESALVLGAGGAAYSVAEALISSGRRVYVLNRTLMSAVKLCSALGAELYTNQSAELVVNCTSVGTNGEDVLTALCVLPKFEYAFDLVYATKTPFLTRCAKEGARVADGRDMLVYQAIEGDKMLFGKDLDTEETFEKVDKILKE